MAIGHDSNVVTPALLPPNELVSSNQMKQIQSRYDHDEAPIVSPSVFVPH